MTENENPSPAAPAADEPTADDKTVSSCSSEKKRFVKNLFDEYPITDEFQEVLRVGFLGLETGDLILARAAADYTITRAASQSGNMLRAMLLRAYVYERSGNQHRHNELVNAVLGRRF